MDLYNAIETTNSMCSMGYRRVPRPLQHIAIMLQT